jgi:hypothetical protein
MSAAVTERGRPLQAAVTEERLLQAAVTESGRWRCQRPLQEAAVTGGRYRKRPLQAAVTGSGRRRWLRSLHKQCPEAGCLNIYSGVGIFTGNYLSSL